MAEMNKIKSFRSFSDVLAHEAVIKLAVENNAKRSELSTKIASILDSMEITSFEGLEEEQKTAIISQLFGEISEEETEENLPEVSDEEEQQVDEAKFVKDFNKDVLNAKTREEVLELYPNAEFFTGKSDHFFGELDNNLFFKAYYTKAQKEFSIKSVYSKKGSNYVHLYNRIGESVVNEAIKVEGKRDAKKVVTVYNKIFNKVLVDLGAMSTESILGCIKYLTFEAMGDANFHREADAVSKMIKGNIKPLEIKMNGLGGHFIKIGPATIKSILDKYYSDIANAAGWSGIGIVEGTALYLEQIKQEAMGQAAINKFNQTFEGEDIRVDLDSKINESNEEATKLEERNAFLGARAKAIEEDLEEFEFNGKTYPVTINEDSLSEEVVTEEVEEVEEGNAFGDAVRKAKEAGDKEFEFDGKTYKVEEAVTEAKFDKKKLMKAMKHDDGIIQLANGDEFIIYNPDNGNDENTAMWNDKVIFALDQDGEEHEVKYSDIVSYNEANN